MEKYFDISSDVATQITGLLPAISAAEMLYSSYPLISNAFLKYSIFLVENFLAMAGEEKEIVIIYAKLKEKLGKSKIATAAQLEEFGDSLAKSKDNISELARLAALSYAATTIYGPISSKLASKIVSAENKSKEMASSGLTRKSSKVLETPSPQPQVPEKPLSLMFAEIARESFKHKDLDIAMTALTAAINELEKSQ